MYKICKLSPQFNSIGHYIAMFGIDGYSAMSLNWKDEYGEIQYGNHVFPPFNISDDENKNGLIFPAYIKQLFGDSEWWWVSATEKLAQLKIKQLNLVFEK